jgi:CheY-like chemotaxis protein
MATRMPGHVTLIASNDVMTRNLLAELLQDEGYLVLSAADGQEALELSRMYRGAIDLFLADVKTTRLDDLCSRLPEERPDVKMLVMLGKDMRGTSGTNGTAAAAPATNDREKLKDRVRAVLAAPVGSAPLVYLAFREGLPAWDPDRQSERKSSLPAQAV